MGKRERETPCGICGHSHKFGEGEVCGICGHRIVLSSEKSLLRVSAFASEILPDFLYLGSFDNASRTQLLKAQGISRVLNTVPGCQTLCNNSIVYHCLQEGKSLPFDDANQFLEQCERDKARVLVHCMSGKSRSPAIVIGFLMKSRRWRLTQGYQWVKDRKPSVDFTEAVHQQLQEYELQIFGQTNGALTFPHLTAQSLSFGFDKCENSQAPLPAFGGFGADSSIFSRASLNIPPHGFVFGAAQTESSSGSDIAMDSS
ncbi:hypothetical protein CDL15_Pgr021586 [Punica granatum]|uniref:Protein-tyrosine-phosphatase IBR5 n=1 Tax=Punica granatum TaxID=22663 RepID=A0A218WTY9_PUNGR|nr:hypothetical protein CDL15_Pgr021586 [Punica granatum]